MILLFSGKTTGIASRRTLLTFPSNFVIKTPHYKWNWIRAVACARLDDCTTYWERGENLIPFFYDSTGECWFMWFFEEWWNFLSSLKTYNVCNFVFFSYMWIETAVDRVRVSMKLNFMWVAKKWEEKKLNEFGDLRWRNVNKIWISLTLSVLAAWSAHTADSWSIKEMKIKVYRPH